MAPKAPPIPDPFCVNYAPTGRASCKRCSGLIAEASIRFGRKVRSPWHDGFDIQWHHLRCGFDWADDLEDLKGWQALKWSDIKKCAKKYAIEIDETHPKVAACRKENEMLWTVRSGLERANMKLLKPVLEANGIFHTHRTTSHEAAHLIADGLIFGKLPQCPVCEQNALIQEGCSLRCHGFVDGAAKCEFRFCFFDLLHPDVTPDNSEMGVDPLQLTRIGRIEIPAELTASSIFKALKIPPEAPALRLFGKPKKEKTRGKGKSAAAEASSDESLSDVPKGKELIGMKFASIGATDPPKRELEVLVTSHGGEFQEDVDQSTTYLLVGDDASGFKSLKRCQTALEFGVPILRVAFVRALLSRTPVMPSASKSAKKSGGGVVSSGEQENCSRPKGVILRRRKYARYYKAAGGAGKLIPKVKEVLTGMAEDCKKAVEREKLQREKRQRPPVASGSPLLEIDKSFPRRAKDRIYVDAFNNVHNVSVNLMDVATGVNKFYTVQLIERESTTAKPSAPSATDDKASDDDDENDSKRRRKRRKVVPSVKRRYILFKKWGRVGAATSLKNDDMSSDFGTRLNDALSEFYTKFQQLTGKEWDDRFDTSVVPGRYRFIELEGHVDGTESSTALAVPLKKESKKTKGASPSPSPQMAECTLPATLRNLIEFIFDRKMMERDLERQNVDLRKMPLGSISKRQMREGYSILQDLQNLLQEDDNQKSTIRWRSKVTAATSRFYTAVPHQFTLAQTPPIIDTLAKLRFKVDMMEELLEIAIASSIMDDAIRNCQDAHPADTMYTELGCRLDNIAKDSNEFQLLSKALTKTHAATHNAFSMQLVEVFSCDRKTETENFKTELENRQLLWHGSRLTNWAGILSKGLRIAPPEAPVTGYMFDKGVYFADGASKSAQYCNATQDSKLGLLVLSEVALGKPYLRLEADTKAAANCAKNACNHTWGVGRLHPDPSGDVTLKSDIDDTPIVLHSGAMTQNDSNLETARLVETSGETQSLVYNEFVVYQEAQVRMRYVLLVNFIFRSILDDSSDSSDSDD